MTDRSTGSNRGQSGARLPVSLALGLVAVVLFFVAAGGVAYWNVSTLMGNALLTTHTHDVLTALDDVLALMKDAETGQRGFVITGESQYLDPYNAALGRIDARLADLGRLTADNPDHQARLPALRESVAARQAQLAEVIATRRDRGFEAARAIIATDRGKAAMDGIRVRVETMEQAEREIRTRRRGEMEAAYRVAVVTGILTGLLGVALSGAVGHLVRRSVIAQQQQDWLKSGQVGLSAAVAGDKRLDQVGDGCSAF